MEKKRRLGTFKASTLLGKTASNIYGKKVQTSKILTEMMTLI